MCNQAKLRLACVPLDKLIMPLFCRYFNTIFCLNVSYASVPLGQTRIYRYRTGATKVTPSWRLRLSSQSCPCCRVSDICTRTPEVCSHQVKIREIWGEDISLVEVTILGCGFHEAFSLQAGSQSPTSCSRVWRPQPHPNASFLLCNVGQVSYLSRS